MDYETGKAFELLNEKMDLLLQKAYPKKEGDKPNV